MYSQIFIAGSIASIFIAALVFSISGSEITSYQYADIDAWVLEVPSVKPLVSEFISDGEITVQEYEDIKQYVLDESKRSILSKVSEAQ